MKLLLTIVLQATAATGTQVELDSRLLEGLKARAIGPTAVGGHIAAIDAVNSDPNRITLRPQQGRKVFTLQTLPDCVDDPLASTVGKVAGFSLHAGIAARANERENLERLCRFIARLAVSTKRLSLTRNVQVRYELKTPWRNRTTHVIFKPLDFISRLVALVPKPRDSLTRFHGVFAHISRN